MHTTPCAPSVCTSVHQDWFLLTTVHDDSRCMETHLTYVYHIQTRTGIHMKGGVAWCTSNQDAQRRHLVGAMVIKPNHIWYLCWTSLGGGGLSIQGQNDPFPFGNDQGRPFIYKKEGMPASAPGGYTVYIPMEDISCISPHDHASPHVTMWQLLLDLAGDKASGCKCKWVSKPPWEGMTARYKL